MTPSPIQATVLVDELVRCGVTEAVVSPGSWSTPLALALHDHPGIRLHVRIDERSASFLALGLAKTSGQPVPVLCTSGTAAANFHPAVLEADAAGVPLVVLTADRAPELRATGFNQTIDQLKLYGDAVRFFAEVGTAEARPGGNAYWRSLVGRAIGHATDPAHTGPVHLNLAFRKPFLLDPDALAAWPEPLSGRPDGAPWVDRVVDQPRPTSLAAPARGVLVLGDGASDVHAALKFAETVGWPVLAEPTSGGRFGPNALSTHTWLLQSAEFVSRHAPDMVVTLGKPTLSQGELTEGVLGLVRAADQHVVIDPTRSWVDPMRTASRVIPRLGQPVDPQPDPAWLASWRAADEAARKALDAMLDESAEATEPAVAREVGRFLPNDALLFVGSSMPIRDLDATLPVGTTPPAGELSGPRILTNRGASGIDGVVSSALGAALAHQRAGGGPAVALLGDLTMLHDQNGLVLGPAEPRPDLTIVVVNNDGGAIFSLLPQGSLGDGFERMFGTPHGVDFAHIAATAGLPYQRVTRLSELPDALSLRAGRSLGAGQTGTRQTGARGGIRLVEVRTDRTANAELHARLRKTIGAAVAEWLG